MDKFTTIIAFVSLIAAALITISVVNSRQTKRRLIGQRLKQLKRKVTDLEEIASVIGALTGSTSAERAILDEIIELLRGMQQLSQDTTSVDAQLENALSRLEEISAPGYQSHLNRINESDAKINRARYLIGEAAIIVRKRQLANKITLNEMTPIIDALTWAHLMVYVISLADQGNKAAQGGNMLHGVAFYKQAQQALKESPINDPRKHDFIRELSEIQADKQKSISLALMPEAQKNSP